MIILSKVLDLIVVDFALSMKVIHLPLSLIGYFSIGVVECSKAVHFVIKPVSVIFTAIDVEECAETVSLVIFDLAHVLGA